MKPRVTIQEGMTVRGTDGEKLGRVKSINDDGSFIVEKGLFFREDYPASLANVIAVRGDEVIYEKAVDAEGRPIARTAGPSVEVRVPLAVEQLVVETEARQQGEVRVRKEVVTEMQEVTVPVQKERVTVERVPAGEARPAPAEAFKETEISVPVMEEEVRVTKVPVVREEVRIKKQPMVEQQTASAEVRHEEAHVEEKRREQGTVETQEGGMRAPGRDEDVKK
jgi:uncharacterized protein (TIGR02271 family)